MVESGSGWSSIDETISRFENEMADRHRIVLSVAPEPFIVLGDPALIRHALSSILGRCLDVRSAEPVRVLVRPSGDDAAVDRGTRAAGAVGHGQLAQTR